MSIQVEAVPIEQLSINTIRTLSMDAVQARAIPALPWLWPP